MKRSLAHFLLTLSFVSTSGLAEIYHYKNILVGERASGLGGAFTALSDDPSGIFYNPAGLAFSFENYISLSANAYYTSKLQYKNVGGTGQDYTLKSSNFLPLYFGFSQTLGKGKMGLAIIMPESDLYDQDDTLEDFTSDPTNVALANYLSRRFIRQDTTYLVAPAYAREISKNFSMGFTFGFQVRVGKSFDNQLVAYNPVPTGSYLIQQSYIKYHTYSLLPKLGFQYMPAAKWSVGLTFARPTRLSGSLKRRTVSTKTEDSGVPSVPTGSYENDLAIGADTFKLSVAEPIMISLGNSYFFNKRFLLSADLDFYTADSLLNVKSTYNWSLGTEWYVTETMPLRFGVYSNNSNSKTVVGDYTSVDLLGASFSTSLVSAGSSFSVGLTYSKGTGLGQIVKGDAPAVLVQTQTNFFIMGSYQL